MLLIALFLPWFSFGQAGFGPAGFSLSALDAKGWTYLVFFLSLGVLAYLIMRALWDGTRLPLPHWQGLTGATGFSLLLTLLSFLTKPAGSSWSFGAYLGLVAAIAAVVGSVIRGKEPEVLPADGSAATPSFRQPSVPRPVPRAAPPITPTPAAAGHPNPNPQGVPTVEQPQYEAVVGGPAATAGPSCANCGRTNPPGNKFCNGCGGSLSPSAAPASGA